MPTVSDFEDLSDRPHKNGFTHVADLDVPKSPRPVHTGSAQPSSPSNSGIEQMKEAMQLITMMQQMNASNQPNPNDAERRIQSYRDEVDRYSRKVQELQNELNSIKNDHHNEKMNLITAHNATISDLKDTIYDLKQEKALLEMGKDKPLIREIIESLRDTDLSSLLPLLSPSLQSPTLPQPSEEAPISNPAESEPMQESRPSFNKQQLLQQMLGLAVNFIQDKSVDLSEYARVVQSQIQIAQHQGQPLTSNDYILLAESLASVAVDQNFQPERIATAISPLFDKIGAVKTVAKYAPAEELTGMLLGIIKRPVPEPVQKMLTNVLQAIKQNYL